MPSTTHLYETIIYRFSITHFQPPKLSAFLLQTLKKQVKNRYTHTKKKLTKDISLNHSSKSLAHHKYDRRVIWVRMCLTPPAPGVHEAL